MLSTKTHRYPLVRVLFGVASLWLLAPTADAALFLSVGSTTLQKPISGTQNFSLLVSANAVDTTETISGYSLDIDVEPPSGPGLPPGLVLNGAVDEPGGSGFFFPGASSSGDLFVQEIDDFDPATDIVVNSGSSVGLFQLSFSANDTLAPGVYNVSLENVTLSGPSSVLTHMGGTITVSATAVPEPGSMALLGIASLGIAGAAYRRRNRQAAEPK